MNKKTTNSALYRGLIFHWNQSKERVRFGYWLLATMHEVSPDVMGEIDSKCLLNDHKAQRDKFSKSLSRFSVKERNELKSKLGSRWKEVETL